MASVDLVSGASLKVKFILILAGVNILGFTIILTLNFFQTKGFVVSSIEREHSYIATYTAISSAQSIFEHDQTYLSKTLEALTKQGVIVFTVIKALDKSVISKHLKKGIDFPQSLESNLFEKKKSGVGHYRIITRAVHYNGKKIADFSLVYTIKNAADEVSKSFLRNILQSLFILVILSTIIYSFLHKQVLRQTKLLIDSSKEIIKGNYTALTPIVCKNELGHLANVFNQMMTMLTKTIEQKGRALKHLARTNEDLEGIVKDRTLELEQERMKSFSSAKLASLGEMAGGIAHEINNPLTIIKLNTDRLKNRLSRGEEIDSDKMHKFIDKINETLERITNIIQGLKVVSRDSDEDPFEKIELRTILTDVFSLCQEKFHNEGVDVKVDLSEAIYDKEIECKRVQLSQVLINLFRNAFDAVEGSDGPWIQLKVIDEETYIKIQVIDSGEGISEKASEKLFEPFFTTKPVGKGTGLGLSLSYTIITEGHNGEIFVCNESPNTCFTLRLPVKQS